MKTRLSNYNSCFRTSIFTFLMTLVLTIAFIPFIFFDLMDVTFGILLGGIIPSFLYFLQGFFEEKSHKEINVKINIIFTTIRFFIFILAIVANSILYYRLEIKLFNLFSLVGGMTLSVIAVTIVTLREKEQ